jgi:mannose-6-phosphate isomerase-like protein (cupin superfamily)
MTSLDPGWSSSPHSHEIEEEIWFVLSGTGLATVADDTINIEKDTSIYIPPGQPHQLVNNGSEQMRVLWVVSPPGLEESYLGKKGGRPPVDGGPPTQS